MSFVAALDQFICASESRFVNVGFCGDDILDDTYASQAGSTRLEYPAYLDKPNIAEAQSEAQHLSRTGFDVPYHTDTSKLVTWKNSYFM